MSNDFEIEKLIYVDGVRYEKANAVIDTCNELQGRIEDLHEMIGRIDDIIKSKSKSKSNTYKLEMIEWIIQNP